MEKQQDCFKIRDWAIDYTPSIMVKLIIGLTKVMDKVLINDKVSTMRNHICENLVNL
jgi:hypothetical protein